jgi:hypothetical protein
MAPDCGIFILEPGGQGGYQTGCTVPHFGIFILEQGSQVSYHLRVPGILQDFHDGGSHMDVSGAKNVRELFRSLFASNDPNRRCGCASYLRFLIFAGTPQSAERTRMLRQRKGPNSAQACSSPFRPQLK